MPNQHQKTPGWQTIESAPKDGRELLGYGLWAGEINGIESSPVRAIISWSGGRTDYAGFDWRVGGGDAYSAWLKPTHWMPLPDPPESGT